MKTTILCSIIGVISLGFSGTVHAQDGPWTIITVSGDTLRACTLYPSTIGRIQLVCGNSASHISVDSVREISKIRHPHFLRGAGYGALLGSVVGLVIGLASYEKPKSGGFNLDFGPGFSAAGGAMVGGLGGFALGGVIGAASGGTDVHDLSAETHNSRVMILNQLAAEDD